MPNPHENGAAKNKHHGGSPPPPPPPPFTGSLVLTASDWGTFQDGGAPSGVVTLTNLANGALAFNFPAPPNHMDYLYSDQTVGSLASDTELTMTFDVVTSGNPQFVFDFNGQNNGPTPASVRFIMGPEVINGNDPYSRWWSNPVAAVLGPGEQTITAPLNPADWSDVNGQFANSSPAAFAAWMAVVADPVTLGMTFGGGYFFGHGVAVTGGTAQFQVLSYKAQ